MAGIRQTERGMRPFFARQKIALPGLCRRFGGPDGQPPNTLCVVFGERVRVPRQSDTDHSAAIWSEFITENCAELRALSCKVFSAVI